MEQLIQGIVIGSIIAFVALGYSLVYSILKFINFAHGELMMIGAYFCYIFSNILHIEPFFLSAVISVALTGFVGVIIEKIAYKPLRNQNRLSMLLSSFGVSIILQAVISLIFSSSVRVFTVTDPIISIGVNNFYVRELIIISFLIITFVSLNIIFKYSIAGLSIRAISSNNTKTMLLGVNTDRIISYSFFAASSLAAIAGISLGIEIGLTPSMGFQYSIWAFIVAIIAGLGSIRGIIISGLVFGVLIYFIILYTSVLFANAVAMGLMSLFLLIKPEGIFSFKLRKY